MTPARCCSPDDICDSHAAPPAASCPWCDDAPVMPECGGLCFDCFDQSSPCEGSCGGRVLDAEAQEWQSGYPLCPECYHAADVAADDRAMGAR